MTAHQLDAWFARDAALLAASAGLTDRQRLASALKQDENMKHGGSLTHYEWQQDRDTAIAIDPALLTREEKERERVWGKETV